MTEPQGGSVRPHYLELLDRLIAAPDSEARWEILNRNAAEHAHLPRKRPVMPPHEKKRHSLTQLMPRHLAWLEKLATRPSRGGSPGRPGYDRSSMHQRLCEHWNSFFAPLRGSIAKTVPSDESGNVWDNAAMESFFSSLKTERTARRMYRTRDDAKADVFDYIERFYNPKRRHSTIGYLSPMEFERQAGLA
jgi:hypothetical protein